MYDKAAIKHQVMENHVDHIENSYVYLYSLQWNFITWWFWWQWSAVAELQYLSLPSIVSSHLTNRPKQRALHNIILQIRCCWSIKCIFIFCLCLAQVYIFTTSDHCMMYNCFDYLRENSAVWLEWVL